MKSQQDDVALKELSEARQQLEKAGIRPTQLRLALCATLFCQGQRHVNAETLRLKAHQSSIPVSLDTIYNTLNHFADRGLIRRGSVNGQKTSLDTCAGDHHHLFIEAEDRVLDIPDDAIGLLAVAQ